VSAIAIAAGAQAQAADKLTTPADVGMSDYAYRVSKTDFNIKRSLAKAPINQLAYQDDVSYVKTQQVIRENQDVIYSSAVVNISKGETFSVPKSETHHIIQSIDMQNYIVDVVYPGKSITVTPNVNGLTTASPSLAVLKRDSMKQRREAGRSWI